MRLTRSLPVLEIGQIVYGNVSRGAAASTEYGFRVNTTDEVRIDVTSDAIDSLVEVYADGGTDPIASDDDSGGQLNARLTLPSSPNKRLIVVVRDVNGGGGEFQLTAARVRNPGKSETVRLSNGAAVSASLDSNSQKREGLNYPYARYVFRGTAGQRVQIDARSEAFDPQLELRFNDEWVGSDRDSGVGTDARMIRILPSDGDYVAWVLAPDGGQGAYQIQVQEVNLPSAPAVVREIVPGEAVEASFDLTSPLQDNRAYALYRVGASAGQAFQAKLLGRDATPDPARRGRAPEMTLQVGMQTPAGFAALGTNISAGLGELEALPAMVDFTFEEAGELMLRVIGEVDWLGPYTLTVEESAVRPDSGPPAAR